MKNIFIILTLLCFISCSTNYESKAEKQLKETLSARYYEDKYKIRDSETLFANESICIIHFTLEAENRYGGTTMIPMEYVQYSKKDSCGNAEDYQSLKEIIFKDITCYYIAKKQYKTHYWENTDEYKYVAKLKDEDRKAWYIYRTIEQYGDAKKILNKETDSSDW